MTILTFLTISDLVNLVNLVMRFFIMVGVVKSALSVQPMPMRLLVIC